MLTYVIATALVQYNDKYLIAKRASTKKFSPNEWEFISGFIEEKETLEETILREIFEETSLKGKILATSSPFVIIDNVGRWIVIPYIVQSESDIIQLNAKDHSEYLWVKKVELKNYKDLCPFITGLKEAKLL